MGKDNIEFKMAMFGLMLAGAIIYGARWLSQSVQVDAVHTSNSYSNVLVRSFPLTDHGRIEWWLSNRGRLKDEYDIPKPYFDGSYRILFWAWDGVYLTKDEGADLRCFEDMQDKANCIVKGEIPMQVSYLNDGSFIFYVGASRRLYYQAKEGDEPKRRRDLEEARE